MNSQRLYIPIYASTLLLSAFLLFAIQPMFGKMILPMLGGTPAVWNLAMVFFQAALLGGYLYAHLLSRTLKPRMQATVHLLLLLAFAFALPIAIPAGWEPPATDDPTFWQLRLMAVAVGGPFFALSASAPLLQYWFSNTGHKDADNPYFLYAASNIGSLGALLLYPVAFEPLLTSHQQSVGWAVGYCVLAGLIALCAMLTGKQAALSETSVQSIDDMLTPGRIGLWLLLAFIPSSLMLGVTTFITTDLASAPLLWIIPLAIYVGTFIIAFARQWPVRLDRVLFWQGILFTGVIGIFISGYADSSLLIILLHLALFGLTALFCHMQLAALRPQARHLTAFYLIMSAGGVLGGIFNALLAPKLFTIPVEYAMVLAVSGFLRHLTDPAQSLDAFGKKLKGNNAFALLTAGAAAACLFHFTLCLTAAGTLRYAAAGSVVFLLILVSWRRWIFAGLAALVLLLHPGYDWDLHQGTLTWKRNFFGVMRVVDSPKTARIFFHGTTIHGAQPLEPKYRLMPVTYYYKLTPAADIFSLLNGKQGPQRVAGLGLGIGCIACFAHSGRHFEFYEIDPDVAAIAEDRSLFTYLSGCGSPYTITIGDARLKIAKVPDHSYDLIFVDTFSSDNIPVHLITREAFALYLRKLKPGGFIAINISNRHLELEPVIAAVGRDLSLRTLFHSKRDGKIEGTKMTYAGSIFAALAPQQKTLDPLVAKGWHPWALKASQQAWRDDFSNIIGAIRLRDPVADR